MLFVVQERSVEIPDFALAQLRQKYPTFFDVEVAAVALLNQTCPHRQEWTLYSKRMATGSVYFWDFDGLHLPEDLDFTPFIPLEVRQDLMWRGDLLATLPL